MPRLVCIFITFAFVITFTMTTVTAMSMPSNGEGANELQAKENCRKNAVERLLRQILSKDANSNDAFQQILSQYTSFTGELKVLKQQKNGSAILMVGQVDVDENKIREAVSRLVKQVTSENHVICFLIRIHGLVDESKIGKCQQRFREVSGDTFQRQGFRIMVADELNSELNRLSTVNYDTFCDMMMTKIKQDYPEITVAVIGEVDVTKSEKQDAGFVRDGVVRLKAVNFLSQLQVIEFPKETYRIQHSDGDNADIIFTEKCAMNSAESLTSKVLSWLR